LGSAKGLVTRGAREKYQKNQGGGLSEKLGISEALKGFRGERGLPSHSTTKRKKRRKTKEVKEKKKT